MRLGEVAVRCPIALILPVVLQKAWLFFLIFVFCFSARDTDFVHVVILCLPAVPPVAGQVEFLEGAQGIQQETGLIYILRFLYIGKRSIFRLT